MQISRFWRLGAALIGVLSVLGILNSGVAAASGKPTVTLGSAGNIRLDAATLHATVNPNGISTTYKFEYGKTILYGKSTPSFSLGSGTTPIEVSAEAFGLEGLSTYHFRVVATNSSGSSTSGDGLFEVLTSWKVGGKPVSELSSPATYEDEFLTENGVAEFTGQVLGTTTRVQCWNGKYDTPHSTGALGVEYKDLRFLTCRTFVNEVEDKTCVPAKGVELHLNGQFAQVGRTTINLGEECTVGESLSFEFGGYGGETSIPGAEYKRLGVGMHGQTFLFGNPQKPWTTWLSPGIWRLSGLYAGQAFGIL